MPIENEQRLEEAIYRKVANKHEKSLNFNCYLGDPNLKTMYDQQLNGLTEIYSYKRMLYSCY